MSQLETFKEQAGPHVKYVLFYVLQSLMSALSLEFTINDYHFTSLLFYGLTVTL